jgi:hypothetical protein
MRTRFTTLAALAASLLVAGVAAAAEEATAQPASAPAATSMDDGTRATAKEAEGRLGEKEYKERINVVARKPLRHDIPWIDSRDRSSWHDFTVWHGVRDERPITARKTIGFHAPDPHRKRFERVLLVGRGPIRGPAPAK